MQIIIPLSGIGKRFIDASFALKKAFWTFERDKKNVILDANL